MSENEVADISLVDDILKKMFLNIEEREEFDEESVRKLKDLAKEEELHKVKKVTEAIISN